MGNLPDRFTFKTSPELLARLHKAADEAGLSASDIARIAIIRWLDVQDEIAKSPKGQAIEQAAKNE